MENVNFKLSCVCCGSTEFKNTEQQYHTVENQQYLLYEASKNAKVICSKCGLEDYVQNLVIKPECW